MNLKSAHRTFPAKLGVLRSEKIIKSLCPISLNFKTPQEDNAAASLVGFVFVFNVINKITKEHCSKDEKNESN